MIGRFARWKHVDDDGKPTLDLEGEVVAISPVSTQLARSGFSVLLRKPDGSLFAAPADDLTVEGGHMPTMAIEPGGWSALDALNKLDKFIEDAFPDETPAGDEHEVEFAIRLLGKFAGENAETLACLDNFETWLATEFPDTNEGAGPIDHAMFLLGELKKELLDVGSERDMLKTSYEALAAKHAKPKKPKTEPKVEEPKTEETP